jgi:response regulator RpfG family c-di-GMP phosphodiesterase
MTEKPNILIVDDELGPRESLRMILKPSYNVFIAEDGYKALEIIKQNPIDLITLDLRMPGLSGIDVLKEVREANKDIQVIIITGFGSLGTITTASQYGVYDYISKPFNVSDVTMVVQKSLDKKRYGTDIKKLLEEIGTLRDLSKIDRTKKIFEKCAPVIKELAQKNGGITDAHNRANDLDCFKFLKLVSDILQNKTYVVAEHAERIHHYVTLFFNAMNLSDAEKETLEVSSYFHDVGKIGMEIEYAESEKYIDNNQFQEWKKHPEQSIAILAPVNFSSAVLTAILHHHERYDGRGFPEGLRGDEIPLESRILRIANAYDALLLAKPYPEAYSKEDIARELNGCGEGELDPHLLQIFLKAIQSHDARLQ